MTGVRRPNFQHLGRGEGVGRRGVFERPHGVPLGDGAGWASGSGGGEIPSYPHATPAKIPCRIDQDMLCFTRESYISI